MKPVDRYLILLDSLSIRLNSVIATANHDLSKFGEWQCDYTEGFKQYHEEIEKVSVKIAELSIDSKD